jgi:DNA (cytosine-5)-methyltransferase 1
MTSLAANTSPVRELDRKTQKLRVVGLFAGIGGIEKGFQQAGHHSELLCEIEPGAKRVLENRFPDVPMLDDVRQIDALPDCDIVAAGFPCQDLSQAGRTAGITGDRSGLVGHVFRLVEDPYSAPTWLLLENVPFMLQLERGVAMRFLTDSLSGMGFRWAYRVVDSRAFGVPQRRRRVVLLASRTEDPREILFPDEAGPIREEREPDGRACGFYWTEGVRGLGWAVDAVPTLKGGSTIGIPSPPAIWMPDGAIVTPDIRDAERMQGFVPDWTIAAQPEHPQRKGPRWKLVGNAVTVDMAKWLGGALALPRNVPDLDQTELTAGMRWPDAAWGEVGRAWKVDRSGFPILTRRKPLTEFLEYEPQPLSVRATEGFLRRTDQGSLRFVEGFREALRRHRERMLTVDAKV